MKVWVELSISIVWHFFIFYLFFIDTIKFQFIAFTPWWFFIIIELRYQPIFYIGGVNLNLESLIWWQHTLSVKLTETHIYLEIWDNLNDANNFCLMTIVSQFQVSSPLHNTKTRVTRANTPKHLLQHHKISSLPSIPRRLHSSQTGITINHQYFYI